MELDYSIAPSPLQRVKPALQNWRLYAFVGFFFIVFGAMGYKVLNFTLTDGIQHHGDYTAVDLKAMGQFPFDGQNGVLTDIPKRYRELDGKRVELEGMMWSLHSASAKVAEFQLVYNIQKCCFNGPPQVQERVFVHFNKGKPITWYDQLVAVTGTLHVRLKRNDAGTVESVYDMDLDTIEPRNI